MPSHANIKSLSFASCLSISVTSCQNLYTLCQVQYTDYTVLKVALPIYER